MKTEFLYDWVASPKKSTIAVLFFFASTNYLSILTQNRHLVFITILLGCTLPGLIIIIWASSTKCFKLLKEAPWLAIVSAAILYIYSQFAAAWSVSQINSSFSVNPDFFPITFSALKFIHIQATIAPAFLIDSILQITIIFAPYAFSLLLLCWPKKGGIRMLIAIIALAYFIGAFFGFYKNLDKNLPKIIEYIALSSDFNENKLCKNEEAISAHSVIFLDSSHILGFFPKNTERFKIVPCTY